VGAIGGRVDGWAGWSLQAAASIYTNMDDAAHDRRVTALAALFGSDTDGHLRTNRNLTELWSQFDSSRRGALDLAEFRGCLDFLASRAAGEAPPLSHDDAARLWRRLDQDDGVAPAGTVSVPSLVVFVRSALMAQWSQHRGTVDGSGGSRAAAAASERPSPSRRAASNSGRRRQREPSGGGGGELSVRSDSQPSPARSGAGAAGRQRTPSPSRARRSASPGSPAGAQRPPSPGGVGLYDVLRRARVRAACDVDSLELGYLEPGERVEVIESRNTRVGHRRVKVLFERGVVDWTGQRRVGWTSLARPSGATLLLPVSGSIYRQDASRGAADMSSGSSTRRHSLAGLDLSVVSTEAQMPDWVKRLTTTTPTPSRSSTREARASSVPRLSSSGKTGTSARRPSSRPRSSRPRSRSPSPLPPLPPSADDSIAQAEMLIEQLSPQRPGSTSSSIGRANSRRRRSPSPLSPAGDSAAGLASANAKLAVTAARAKCVHGA
jgi:hypothetical protein